MREYVVYQRFKKEKRNPICRPLLTLLQAKKAEHAHQDLTVVIHDSVIQKQKGLPHF